MAEVMYNRQLAVNYADQWWNRRNPLFPKFEVNCTNYVSQCLNAGRMPMQFTENVGSGWWCSTGPDFSWSYSWSVAHSLRWFLASPQGQRFVIQAETAMQLEPGDIILYDFDGDGTWQHSAFVAAKRTDGQPLVNANTSDSFHRLWTYSTSPSYSRYIKYLFFHVRDIFLD